MAFAGPGLGYHLTGMVIVDSVLYDRGHMIRRWADGIAGTYERHVIDEAPLNKRSNTGHGSPGGLKAGLSTHVERVGPRQLVTAVVSLASYTRYVAGGTGPLIIGTPVMRLPLNPGFGGTPSARDTARGGTLHRVVRGQARNQFFERAFARTAATHPSLRPALGSAFKIAGAGTPIPADPYRPNSRPRRVGLPNS